MNYGSCFTLLGTAIFLSACSRPAPPERAQQPDGPQTDTAPPPVSVTADTVVATAALQDSTAPAAEPRRTQRPARPQVDTSRAPMPAPGRDTDSVAVSGPIRDIYHQAPRDTVDGRTYQGWKYYSLHCSRCHGEDVTGTTIAPHLVLSLKPNGPIPDAAAFLQVVCSGRPDKGMPAWCSLGLMPLTIDTIYAYVKGRSDGTLHPGRPARKAE